MKHRLTGIFARSMILPLACALFFAGCAKKKHHAHGRSSPRVKMTESGIASWYGYPYHGRRAANGEIYDMETLVAAHRTLPFGTWVEVQNLDNGRTVTVRIIDRGPFIDGRIVDLSKAAAREIEMIGPGIAKVRLKVVNAPPEERQWPSRYAIQIGAFQDKHRAESLRLQFEREYGTARLVLRAGNPPVWRVLVGDEPNIETANGLRERVAASGQQSFVVLLDNPGAGQP